MYINCQRHGPKDMDMNMDLDLDMDVSRQKGQTFGTRTARDTFDVQCLSNQSDEDKMSGTFDYPYKHLQLFKEIVTTFEENQYDQVNVEDNYVYPTKGQKDIHVLLIHICYVFNG